MPDDRDALNKAVMKGDRMLLHSLSNQVGIGSNHDCLLGISDNILSIEQTARTVANNRQNDENKPYIIYTILTVKNKKV